MASQYHEMSSTERCCKASSEANPCCCIKRAIRVRAATSGSGRQIISEASIAQFTLHRLRRACDNSVPSVACSHRSFYIEDGSGWPQTGILEHAHGLPMEPRVASSGEPAGGLY